MWERFFFCLFWKGRKEGAEMAFVGSSGVLGRRRRVRGGVCGVRMEAEGGGKSVQEKMAEALGRNLEEERKEASVKLEVVEEELRVKMKGAWKKALLGTVLGTSFWAFQHFGLDNPIYLLHAMEEHSPAVQVRRWKRQQEETG